MIVKRLLRGNNVHGAIVSLELQKQLHLSEAKSEHLTADKNKLVSEHCIEFWQLLGDRLTIGNLVHKLF